MTSHKYATRLERLRAAKKGDTVTVPDGWARPGTAPDSDGLEGLRPGDVFTNDGDTAAEWMLADGYRDGVTRYSDSENLADLGLVVDETDDDSDGFEPIGYMSDDGIAVEQNRDNPACCGCAGCARLCHGCDACDPDDADEDDNVIGTATVRVVPDTTGFADAIADAVPDHVKYRLDEYQRERVAALEQGLRVLESRRAPSGGNGGIVAAFKGSEPSVPMVPVGDLVDVAAFIADGDTGREQEVTA